LSLRLGTILGTNGSGGIASFARQAELAVTLRGRLRQYLGCRKRPHGDKQTEDCFHVSTP
jgi:hypothetical protein